MGTDDKMRAKVDQAKGTIKEKVGDVTNDRSTQAEGMLEKAKGNVREGWEEAKDKARDAKRDLDD